ncbi:GAF domain-containing sensor histidine kinase [Caulobacter segnis]
MPQSPTNASPPPGAISLPDEVAAVSRLDTVQSILEVCLRATGMGYGVVAHVTQDRWLACAVLDEIDFGLGVGGELPIQSTLCNEVRQRQDVIAFDHASADPEWRDHHTPKAYGLESYIAVPITLADGEFFGTLCAIDPNPAPASKPSTVKMFELFAKLISAELSSQQALRASQVALVDANATAELRDQFIAVLGHDLRNPLASIEAGATLLERRASGAGVPAILTQIRRSTERMGRLIDDVLDFARGRLGGGLLAMSRPSDLSPVLAQALHELRNAHPERLIESTIDLGASVACDPDRIAQLTSNLLANAIVHGDPDVPVSLVATLDADAFVLTIRNGGTMSPETEARLFRPFSRGATGEFRDGLGLGLYIAHEIASAHRGTLTATSGPDHVQFQLRLPLA